jgi:D-sedoheptulose 7-phosphate isomerase
MRTHLADPEAAHFGAAFEQSLQALRCLLAPGYLAAMQAAAAALTQTLARGDKILLCGNGGSAADAQHIASELVGRFRAERRGLAAIALTTDSSVLTSCSNDFSFDAVFSRQVEALARPGDLVWGLSTSGNSANLVEAFRAARRIGCRTLAMLGRDGGSLRPLSDLVLLVPLEATDQIQTAHQLSYHALCAQLDARFAEGR